MKLDAPEITIFANMQHTHASAAQGGPSTAPETIAAAAKATPVDADQLPLVDSAASNVLKKLTWANAKSTLKTYFDTLYTNNTGTVTNVSALTLGTTGTNLSSTIATGTTTPVITLQVPNASATNRGALLAADWTTFNNKQAALTPAALTKTDDTNIVLTLGGTPATALLQAASITVTWSGLLAVSRGGTGLSGFNANGVVYASSASALATSSTGLNFDNKNLGVGAIPTDGGACTNIELPFGATISARSNTTAPQLAMMSNAVGNWFAPTYKINGFATQYTMQGFDGGHVWYVAPSGVAGNAISFVNGMTLAQDRTVTMHKYGAGIATFSAGGVISSKATTGTGSVALTSASTAWTPVPTATTPGATPPTFTSATGTYIRVGNLVYVTYDILFNANGTGAGQIKIAGLPFNLAQRAFGAGVEIDVVGFFTLSNGIAGTDFIYVGKPDAAYPGGTSYRLLGSFTYSI